LCLIRRTFLWQKKVVATCNIYYRFDSSSLKAFLINPSLSAFICASNSFLFSGMSVYFSAQREINQFLASVEQQGMCFVKNNTK
jgi:hypothetical protein